MIDCLVTMTPPTRRNVRIALWAVTGLLFVCLTMVWCPAEPAAAGEPLSSTEGKQRIIHYLRAQGHDPVEDPDDQDRLMRWLSSRSESAWGALRNVHFRRVFFEQKLAPGRALQGEVSVHEIEARFAEPLHAPDHLFWIEWKVFLRDAGYPSALQVGKPGSPDVQELIDTAFCTIMGFDGRRLLIAQYPSTFHRTARGRHPDGRERVEYYVVDGDAKSIGEYGFAFPAVLDGTDVLIAEKIAEHDDVSMKKRFDATGMQGLSLANPWFSVLHERGRGKSATPTLRSWMADESIRTRLTWWKSEDQIVVLHYHDDVPVISGSVFIFDAATGLPLEMSRIYHEDGEWAGLIALGVEYVRVTSEAGESLMLPRRVYQASGVSSFFARSLDVPSAALDADPGGHVELSQFFDYLEVNGTRLARPEAFAFQHLAERLGVRLAPRQSAPGAMELHPAPDLVFGPPRNAPDYLAEWDRVVGDMVRASGVPLPPNAILPFVEIMRTTRRNDRGYVYQAYYHGDDGERVDLPTLGTVLPPEE